MKDTQNTLIVLILVTLSLYYAVARAYGPSVEGTWVGEIPIPAFDPFAIDDRKIYLDIKTRSDGRLVFTWHSPNEGLSSFFRIKKDSKNFIEGYDQAKGVRVSATQTEQDTLRVDWKERDQLAQAVFVRAETPYTSRGRKHPFRPVSTAFPPGTATRDQRAALDDLTNDIESSGISNVHSLMLVHQGKTIYENYFYGFDAETPHQTRSITKGLSAMVFGIAVGEGLVKPDDPLAPLFPGHSLNAMGTVTFENLLKMDSGLPCHDLEVAPSGVMCSWSILHSDSWLSWLKSRVPNAAPGKAWRYNGAALVYLAEGLQKKAGIDWQAYAQEKLFTPLGIAGVKWHRSPAGEINPAHGLRLATPDLARLGQLVLDRGQWNGKQVIRSSWIEKMIKPYHKVAETGFSNYGYLWWAGDIEGVEFAMAQGYGGQYLVVYPQLDLVLVVTSGNYTQASESTKILDRLGRRFLERFDHAGRLAPSP